MRLFTASFVIATLLAAPAAAENKFGLDGGNIKVKFTGSKPDGSKHVGGFRTVSGSATAGADPTTLKLAVDIDVRSLYSDNVLLTAHLKSPDFFAVKKYPRARFVSTKVEPSPTGYTVTGELTMLGKTKSISFPAQLALSADALTLSASFTINRGDWGMTYGKGKIEEAVGLNVSVDARK